jgi:hypothetical protein
MVVIDLILVGSALFAARKTVRENLVKDLIVNPLRAVIRIIDRKLLQPCRRKRLNPCGVNHSWRLFHSSLKL